MTSQPYREDPPLARYALRTAWRTVLALAAREVGLAVALAAGALRISVMLRVIEHEEPASPIWLAVLALVPLAALAAWLRHLPRLVVPRGTAIELRRDRLDIVAPSAPTRGVPLSSLRVTVSGTVVSSPRVVDGKRVRVAVQRPSDVVIVGPDVRFEVSATVFETPADAARLAADVDRVREGKLPLERGRVDLAAIQSIVEEAIAIGAVPRGEARRDDRDELDDRIDRELAALDEHVDGRSVRALQ